MDRRTPKTMKALVAYSKSDYRLETAWPVPDCGDDEVILKTEGCGICAGDLKCMHGADMFWGVCCVRVSINSFLFSSLPFCLRCFI